ncbi:hypothetical protein AVEN_234396-1 [Araneus ventricosus]|uniref:DUF19 domain-containing protein n=1 Tax=Araneus ventricosus TaxID=182803 RepID=A0A4Y2A9U4_ARAVE|nr:hypothetical protein AVEN_234396-1 [Araneus ventricosus]
MLSLLTFVLLCLVSRETRAFDEELETDQFIDALCVPDTMKAIAQCADLLPQTGKETVYSCGRNVSQTFQDKMILAAETFCEREDVRDLLFLCWEKGLSELYETSREEEVDEDISKGMNDFQACLQEVLDGLFEE